MAIKDSTIQAVRQVPLTSLLKAEGIHYKRIGREAVTICPWHTDSNPSLTINDDKNLCFCFACGGGTDGISYAQQKFGLSFADAVVRIAEKHQIEVLYDDLDPEEALRLAKQRKQALQGLKDSQNAFRSAIRGDVGYRARQWLAHRNITPDSSRTFELGWAESGYFAGRVTVPIHDHRGTLVGFTGRQIDDQRSPQKYKNSVSSDVFDKGALLFNEHRALGEARIAGSIVFVEGHFDVISMWQHGIRNVVATQGTAAPSIESVRRMMRQCRRFVLCYDGDDGGTKAIEAFIKVVGPMACKGDLTVTIAQLPAGNDPDDCIRSGVDLYGIIEEAPQWLDWQIDCWLAGLDRADTHRFSAIEKAIRDLVESITSPALRQHYIDKASKVLAADSKAAIKLAQSWSKSLGKVRSNGRWSKPSPSWTRHQVEKRALRSYIHFPSARQRLAPVLDSLETPSYLWLWNRIKELESVCDSVTPGMVMSLLAVCEPQYTRILRPIAVPTIKLIEEDGILDHAESVLLQRLEIGE